MEKYKRLQKIKDLYAEGGNIIQYLKDVNNRSFNEVEDILMSYEFQSGTYIKNFYILKEHRVNYCSALAKLIDKFEEVDSIIEVGVGEATTLTTLISLLKYKPAHIFGFDISWSRLKFAKGLLKDFKFHDVNLFAANLFEIPLLDNAIDIVYTSHSIEPNGGKEEIALKELYRITKKYLILLEPSYELAGLEARERIKKHGYVTELYNTAKKLNYSIIEHRLFDYSANPLNPTGLIIIEKERPASPSLTKLVCPVSYTELMPYNEHLLYSKDSYLAYPVVDNIPLLLKENAILASHLLTDYEAFKSANDLTFNG